MSELPAPIAQPDLHEAIKYALLVKSAEDVPPDQTVYHPADIAQDPASKRLVDALPNMVFPHPVTWCSLTQSPP